MENFETYKLDQTGQQTQAILDQVATNTADIEQLRALYEALTQSEPVIIQPSDTWPVADPQENVIYRVIDRVNTPPQSYSDYMWNGTAMVLMATYNNSIDNEPTPGSNNLVKSGGVAASIVFDISAYHATGSTLATYSNLAAALGTDGANVPASVRKGGMSVKFVNSSDNKYVQYRLTSDSFNTTPANWQGVDDEPTAGSDNLVKSGGISLSIAKAVLGNDFTYGKKLVVENGVYSEVDDANYIITPYIEVNPTDASYKIFWHWGRNVSSTLKFVIYNESKEPLDYYSSTGTERDVRIGAVTGYKYYRVNILLSDFIETTLFDRVIGEYSYKIDNSVILNEKILNKTVRQLFVSQNDGRFIEVYSDGLDNNYKYYFKYFRWYNGKVQARLYKYTQDDKSDEVLVGSEDKAVTNNILQLTGPGICYVVHNVSSNNINNLQSELNVHNCSSLSLCPNVNAYINQQTTNNIVLNGWELHKNFLSDGSIVDNDLTAISPFIEVEQNLNYILDWEWGYTNAQLYLVVYDDKKNVLGAFSSTPTIAGEHNRETRISALSGYKYYRVSIRIDKSFDTYIFDRHLNYKTIEFKSLWELSSANQETIDDDLVVFPSITYLLKDSENSIYHKNYLKYERDNFYISPATNFMSNGWKFLERCFRVANSNSNSIQFNLIDTKSGVIIKKEIMNCLFGDAAVSTPKKVTCIGDSFTYNGTWFQHIYDVTEGLTFVGMRKSYQTSESLRAEGRGGWTLESYFTPHEDVTPTHMQPFSPFMHVTGYTYYGVIDFWKAIVNDNSQYTYGTNGFDDYKSWFDTNGYKVNPSANDLMYDGVNDKYVYYNGSSWVDYSGTPEFVFDYAKYISTWNIDSPDIVIIMLGKNDFQYRYNDADFVVWANKMDTVINSIHDYNSSIIVGVCTPAVANDSPNNSDNNSDKLGARYMWLARKAIIDTFDTDSYKNQNVFVVDSGVCLDPLYGFQLTEMKPFSFYSGNVRELISTNGVHPSTGGYKQIGTCVAGFIQTKR